MTVKELRDFLYAFDDDTEVWIYNSKESLDCPERVQTAFKTVHIDGITGAYIQF